MKFPDLELNDAALKQPRPPISSKANTGYCYFGLSAIGPGLGNLFFGFRDGQIWWISIGL